MMEQNAFPKRGDIHPETGKVFESHSKGYSGGERWVTPEQFEKRLVNDRIKARRRHAIQKVNDPGRIRAKSSRRYAKNRAALAARTRAAQKADPEFKTKRNKYERERRLADPLYCLRRRVAGRIRQAFYERGYSKSCQTAAIIGCEWEVLFRHIDSQFASGMTWDNRNLWHIDHIVPLASARTPEEVIALCHYTNLQPLWAAENMSKSDRVGLRKTTSVAGPSEPVNINPTRKNEGRCQPHL